MTSLREAREQGEIDQFIAERKAAAHGDQKVFDATLKAMAGTSKSAPGTLKPGRSGD